MNFLIEKNKIQKAKEKLFSNFYLKNYLLNLKLSKQENEKIAILQKIINKEEISNDI